MQLEKVIHELSLKDFTPEISLGDSCVEHVVASDLMSEVLVVDNENIVLVTSLATDQTVRTANIVDASAIVLVNGKTPPGSMIALANELEIPILGKDKPLFEVCVCLGRILGVCNVG